MIARMRKSLPGEASLLVRLLRDETGITMIEYGFTASMIAIAIIVATHNIGTNVANAINNVSANL